MLTKLTIGKLVCEHHLDNSLVFFDKALDISIIDIIKMSKNEKSFGEL